MNKSKLFFKNYSKVINPFIPIITILIMIWLITLLLTGGKWYYSWQFKKNDTLKELTWQTKDGELMEYTDEDLLEIRDAIVEYLFNKRDSMQVEINEHEFFSKQALEHMHEVKKLFNRWNIITIVLCYLIIPWFLFFVRTPKEYLQMMFKPTYITYAIIGGIILIIGIMMLINFDWTFTWFHHVLFPNKTAFNDAFFTRYSNYEVDNNNPYINNLMLVTVLSIEVFMDAAWIIVAFAILVIVLLFIFTFINRKKKIA